MNPVVVFDVNETLLSLSPFKTWFRDRFEGRTSASTWFAELLRLSFVSSVTDVYVPFTDLAAAALATTAASEDHPVSDADLARMKRILTTLPPHPDVEQGLEILRDRGFTVAALTNSPLATARTQLANAGIDEMFDRVMSVDMVQRFKPHRSVYLAAASELGVQTVDMVMVAAHDWDIAGAMNAGCPGAFVERPGQRFSTAFSDPTLRAPDIAAMAELIVRRFQ
ncbi:MAG: haloacid dehalogenase type II [Actinomycetota bacterium]|nr:haloacid dehalogenase type II [Actinomycetota bacterium]